MKQHIIFLSLFTILFVFSACDKSTDPNEQPVYIDKIEAATKFVETIDSIDYWKMKIKDTFLLSEPPFPRLTVSKILNSDKDTIVAGIVNTSFDTVYFSRVNGLLPRDTLNIFNMPNFSIPIAGKYKIYGYYIHDGKKTVLPEKEFYIVN